MRQSHSQTHTMAVEKPSREGPSRVRSGLSVLASTPSREKLWVTTKHGSNNCGSASPFRALKVEVERHGTGKYSRLFATNLRYYNLAHSAERLLQAVTAKGSQKECSNDGGEGSVSGAISPTLVVVEVRLRGRSGGHNQPPSCHDEGGREVRKGKGEMRRRDRGLEVEHCGRRSPGRFQCTLAVQAATARPLPRRTPAGGYALESAAASWGSARSR